MDRPQQPWTVQRILEWTRGFLERKGVDSPRLSTELLLSHVLQQPRIRLYTDYQRPLTDEQLLAMRELVRRAGEDEPIAYLTGVGHFFSLEFKVTPDVLIPRPDTETLVEQAMTIARRTPGFEAPRILDLCTGSGCVAAALAKNLPASQVVGVDISPAAVAVAVDNVQALGLAERVTVLAGDLFAPLTGLADPRPFELIVANPPYIATSQMAGLQRSVKNYEPALALDGGPDGLAAHRRILSGAPDRLAAGGWVLLEIAFDQHDAALALAAEHDAAFGQARVARDHAGNPRVLTLQKR